MSWKVRHEGSPRAVEGLNAHQIIQGLLDGRWEPTDEVMGPSDSRWVALEAHPQFADVALEIEPPPPKIEEDESRLDMNALIDVCLVLLVFFILTTSYAAIQKMLDMPNLSADNVGVPKVTKQQVDQYMIKVDVAMEKGEEKDVPVIRVEGTRVELSNLVPVLAGYVKNSRKSLMLLDHKPNVPHGVVVAIQDAAKGAGIERVNILVPKEELLTK